MAKDSTVKIECRYVTKTRRGTAICIRDGSECYNEFGKKVMKEFWIPVSQLVDSSFESIDDLTACDAIEIFIPEWLALEKGLI